MQLYGFRDSCVVALDTRRVVEEASALPLTICPAFVGSGNIGVGIDASGLQGVDSRMAEAFGHPPAIDDLYILRQDYISEHLRVFDGHRNFTPLGFLDWTLRIGDETYITSANLPEHATCWRRTTDLETASVETEMLLDQRIKLRIRLFIPHGGTRVFLEVGLRAFDIRNRPITDAIPVTFRLGLHLTTRDGRPIHDAQSYTAQGLEVAVQGLDYYRFRYRWQGDDGLEAGQSLDWYGLTAGEAITADERIFRCALDVDAPELPAPWDYAAEWQQHQRDWAAFWAHAASIDIGDLRREFLYRNSLYLLRTGVDHAHGASACFLNQHSQWWQGCTFWDMAFLVDGLIRAGAAEVAVPNAHWLARVARPEGRPFPWKLWYNGETPVNPKDDIGYNSVLGFTSAAIRLYWALRDEALFTEAVWPVCDKTCRFLVEEMFVQEGEHFVVGIPCGHDIGYVSEAGVNDTYTAVWGVSMLAKCLQLADDHGVAPDWAERARAITAHYAFENDGQVYLHARGRDLTDGEYASWLPMLLYPTEGGRFLDMPMYQCTRARTDFPTLYFEKQGDSQPWCTCWNAMSDLYRGDAEECERLLQLALGQVHGPGYFREAGPGEWGGGAVPPLSSAHGAYLAVASAQLFSGSYWDNSVQLLTNCPRAWQERTIQARHIHAGNGVELVSLHATPTSLEAVLAGEGDCVLLCALPQSLSGPDCICTVNGQATAMACDGRKATLTVPLSPGGCQIKLIADTSVVGVR